MKAFWRGALFLAAGASLLACASGGGDGIDDGGDVQPEEDATAPAITDLSVTVDETSATVTWKTDEPAVSRVDYGTSASYGSFVQDLTQFRRDHSFVLPGLAPATAYHFNVTSADSSLNWAQSGDDTFLTAGDVVAPTITNVQVSANGGSTAVVTWTTDELATSRVDYGATTAYGSFAEDAALTMSHSLQMSGLTPGGEYHFAVSSEDGAANLTVAQDEVFINGNGPSGGTVTGSRIAWQPLTISFRGPVASELDVSPNPFLFYRLIVHFIGPSGQGGFVHGFFDGDGQGGGTGDIWRVRYAPDEAGEWTYEAHFDEGPNIATNFDLGDGTPVHFNGVTGSVTILPRDPGAPGFYKWGLLEHVGEHYLKFRDGPYFLKGGTDSPENFLGYKGFDNTVDQPGGAGTFGLENGLHRYLPHVGDWLPGDPLFASADTGYDSKGIIGALNYLASANVNSIYFLPMNLGGDGQETYPFVGAANTSFNKTHYDISKLHQWNQVFEHAQRKGILLHVVLNETEPANEDFLDGGNLGIERSLFYKELCARFAHHLAIKWNLCEETDFSVQELVAFASYIRGVDPYDHPIAFHTRSLSANGDHAGYSAVMGDPRFEMTSIQSSPDFMGSHMERWRAESAAAGRKWVVESDEQDVGLTDSNADSLRRKSLWDVYLSGGNVEWYFGYHDLPLGGDMRTEDFRTRAEMWSYMWYARRFVQTYLPFWEMVPADFLLSGESQDYGGGEVFAKHGEVYAIYLPATFSTGTLDLTGASGVFVKSWYNPRTGSFEGDPQLVTAGAFVPLGPPPDGGGGQDWVVGLIQ